MSVAARIFGEHDTRLRFILGAYWMWRARTRIISGSIPSVLTRSLPAVATRTSRHSLIGAKAYVKGAVDVLSDAEVTSDGFHVVKLLNGGPSGCVGRNRRTVQLKRTRCLRVNNQRSFTESEMGSVDESLQCLTWALDLAAGTLETARAYELELNIRELWTLSPTATGRHLDRWCARAVESGLQATVGVAKTIRGHRPGIPR